MTPALYINLAGGLEAVDPSRAAEVEAVGYVPASAEQAKDYFLREKYGTTGQAALAGAESFGSMLTLGLSTHAETALGVDSEAIAAREKFNPLASGTGGAVGILAPLLLSGGASGAAQGAEAGSAAARAASFAGPSLLANAGRAAARAALRELPAEASLAQRLAAKGLAAAAGGAVEGAGYEVGQLVHESALGDPNLTAESALARIGLSAATFGALSGGGGILGTLGGELFGETGGSGAVRETLAGWLEDLEARSAGKAAGGIQDNIKKLRQKLGGEGANAVLKEIGERGLVDWYTTPSMTAERAQTLMDRAGSTMGDVVAAADEVGAAAGPRHVAVRPGDLGESVLVSEGRPGLADLEGVVRRAREEIVGPMRADPYQQEAAGKLESLLASIAKQGDDVSLKELHTLRMQNDTALYGMRGTMDPYASAYKSALHDLRGLYSRELEAGVERAGLSSDVWKAANREYQAGATALEFAEKGIERSMGNNVFGLSSALWGGVAGTLAGGPLGGLGGTIATEALRRQGSGLAWRAARGLRSLLEGEEGALVANRTAAGIAAERVAGVEAAGASVAARASAAPETAAALSVLAQAQQRVTEEVDSALAKLIKGVPAAVGRVGAAALSRRAADAVESRRLASSPELLQEALARQTDELHHHAPGIAQAAQMATARQLALLAAKAPTTHLPGLRGKAIRPNVAELAKFARYSEIIHQPLKVLDHAQRGTLTPQHVAALRLGWPATYQHIQERFLDVLMDHGGKTITPQSRMMASMLTGFQLDGSFNAIAANQAVYARAGGPPGMPPGGAVPNPNASKLNQANRVRTPTQGLSERLNGGK